MEPARGLPGRQPHTENLTLFSKDVAEATGGKLQIAVHAAASLFKAPEVKRAVQTGQAQMGEVLISNHENEAEDLKGAKWRAYNALESGPKS